MAQMVMTSWSQALDGEKEEEENPNCTRAGESLTELLNAGASRYSWVAAVTGALRVGLSARLAKQAAADLGGVPLVEVEEIWHAVAPPYGDLFAWLEGRAERPTADAPGRFRPVSDWSSGCISR